MRKSMDILPLAPSDLAWLRDRLKGAPDAPEGVLRSVQDLLEGRSDCLLLERAGDVGALSREGEVRTGGLVISPRDRKAYLDGRDIALTPKEFDILHFLARSPGEVFSKERIYREVWNVDFVPDEGNIMAFIRKLRKKVEPDPDEPRYIVTVWGVGYKFVGDGVQGGGPRSR